MSRRREKLLCTICGVPVIRDRWNARIHADGSLCIRVCACGVPMAYDAGADFFVHAFPYCESVHGPRSDAEIFAEVSPEWAAEKARIDRDFREVCAMFTKAEFASLPLEFFGIKP